MTREAVEFFQRAYAAVKESAYAEELSWQTSANLGELTECEFLQEYAWVVVNSGFRESVAKQLFPWLSLSFYDFFSARHIAENGSSCYDLAILKFRNSAKIGGILQACEQIAHVGFANFIADVRANPELVLRRLPFIGPITVHHLMKNIGFDVSKADRHLVRLSKTFGFLSVEQMCEEIAIRTRAEVRIVDLVLWRVCVNPELVCA